MYRGREYPKYYIKRGERDHLLHIPKQKEQINKIKIEKASEMQQPSCKSKSFGLVL
jgi:hypothetical protein